MKILVAEDDVTSRTMLQEVLTKWGYSVMSTCDGEAAYAALQKDKTLQLAVLDWEMPGMDGATLCRKLRDQERTDPLYLILLTSRDDKKDIAQGLAAGADDYISKPYDLTELHARVEVGRRMIRMQNRMRAQERLQGVLEMASAVCHQLDQPLQSVIEFSELLLARTDSADPNYEPLKNIREGIEKIGTLTHKIMNITRDDLKPYMKKRSG